VGLTLTGVWLVTERLPGVMTPVPLAKIPVRLVLPPAVIVSGSAVKLVIVATGVVDRVPDEPPQAARNPKPRPRSKAQAACTRDLFMIFPE
jgi:hypothetical protein